jgi:hypothetical protein
VADRGILEVDADPSTVDHGRHEPDLIGGGGTEIELEALGGDPAVSGLVALDPQLRASCIRHLANMNDIRGHRLAWVAVGA